MKLWKPGRGYLYKMVIEVLEGDQVVDVYNQSVGVRTVEVRGAEFLINGEPFYFTGFGMHEDHAIVGKQQNDALMLRDFNNLKWIGANSMRTSHYPYSEEFMDYADREGLVVIDETPAVGLNTGIDGDMFGMGKPVPTFSPEAINDETQKAHEREIVDLIARDKNRPSVVDCEQHCRSMFLVQHPSGGPGTSRPVRPAAAPTGGAKVHLYRGPNGSIPARFISAP